MDKSEHRHVVAPPDVHLLRSSSTRQHYFEQAAKFLLQQGDQHWACRHPGIVRELLWLWRFPSQSSVQFLQNTLAEQVKNCLQCALALNSARRAALDSDAASAPDISSGKAGKTDRECASLLRDAIRVWDVARLTANFEHVAKPGDGMCHVDYNRRLQGTVFSHIEMLLQFELLILDSDEGKRLGTAFSSTLSALAQGGLSISGVMRPPGLYLLCVHSNKAIRNWARDQVRAIGVLEHPAFFEELHQVLDVMVHHCERITMIRNGCDEEDQEKAVPLPSALTSDECEVWKGLMAVIRQLTPWIVRDRLIPRYGGLVPLALMSLAENSAEVLPAAQCVLYVMKCLGRAFWQASTCSFAPATLRRVLTNLVMNPLAIVPVRHVCLEVLEEVMVSASHAMAKGTDHLNGNQAHMPDTAVPNAIASFLSSKELRSGPASCTAVTAMATRVLTRVLQTLLERGGLSDLPIQSSAEWVPHVAGTACSPNLPESSRMPAAMLMARIVYLQTASLEATLLRSVRSQQSTDLDRVEAAEAQDGGNELPNSAMWLDSVWGWLIDRAGAPTIPLQVHAALLDSARTLLIWPMEARRMGTDEAAILRRFATLIVRYLQGLAATRGLPAQLVQLTQVQQMFFELALVQHTDARGALREIMFCALGLEKDLREYQGVGPPLQAMACRHPTAVAAGLRSAFAHVRQMGLDGAAFSTLHQLFLLTGQMMPLVVVPLLAESRQALLQGCWELTQAFIECRARLRAECVIKRHGNAALDATASSFFACFRTLWPHFSTLVLGAADKDAPSDDPEFDERPHQNLASAHEMWLPAFAKWGGIASLVVRRHWCSCMVDILTTLRQQRYSLTRKEKFILDKLFERRDLWTDEQYLALCSHARPLGAESVRGNVGMGLLADLPGMLFASNGESASAVVDDARKSAKADNSASGKGRNKKSDSAADQPRARKRKKYRFTRGSGGADSLSESSEDASSVETSKKKPQQRQPQHKQQPGGLMSILADLGNASAQKDAKNPEGGMVLTVGGHVVHHGGCAGTGAQLDALGKRTRRALRTVEELQDEFLSHILWWDFRNKRRQGPPCSMVPTSFESLDQYEDVLTPLLLEETWQQIATAFEEERAEVADSGEDFSNMRVLSYNEIGEFAYATVCTDVEPRACGVGSSGASEAWGNCLHESDLVLLVSPDANAQQRQRQDGGASACTQQHKADTQMEHVLALVEKSHGRDSEMGIVRLKLLLRQTPRNKRFCERLGRLAQLHLGAGHHAAGEQRKALDAQGSTDASTDASRHAVRLRMVCLNYSIATSEREFVATHRLRALADSTQLAVLNPGLATQAVCASKGNAAVVSRHSLNQDQLTAIRKCLDPGPFFTLIQGPPGTGKTSTLMGLLTALLAGASGKVQAGARVLVCAPSNAAVDELAKRVSQGLVLEGCSERYRPNVVRVGAKRQMREDVWDTVGLEQQVIRRLAKLEGEQQAAKEELDKLKAEVETLTERIEHCEQRTQHHQSACPDLQALQSARRHALALCAQKAALAGVSVSRKDVLKKQLRSQLLDGAQIVCATLSGAGTTLLQSSARPFDAVVVDEAAQALEPSLLIPLQLNVDRCILVGDPQQLPATVTSRKAEENLYARSLFERLQASGHSAALLAVQYRMHPKIRAFPSQHFYGGKLSDCLGEAGRSAPWHADCRFAPFVFYDIKGDQGEADGTGGKSRSNSVEARACVAIICALRKMMPGGDDQVQKRVAVMSPYRRQCAEIRRRLGAAGLQGVEVSSVDSFQGREVDVALLSCVRSGRGGLGFVADVRRLNVALTRARCSLLIVGDAETLAQNEHWAALVAHARGSGAAVRLTEVALDEVFGDGEGDSVQWRASEGAWPQHLLSL